MQQYLEIEGMRAAFSSEEIKTKMDEFRKQNPADASHVREQLQTFCAPLHGTDSCIAVVTSGGTTVPLEKHCVRFIDNFSSGRRGALSTEELLKEGYFVVHLSRQTSLQPFVRCLPAMSSAHALSSIVEGTSEAGLHVTSTAQSNLKPVWQLLQKCIAEKRLVTIHFVTVFEYLAYLEAVAAVLKGFGEKVMFYLAAAVSDFYVPWLELPEHKIQSRGGMLNLQLQQVPKCLGLLRNEWAPAAFHVSFKLETDEQLLLEKSKAAITNYGVHSVVANELNTRTERVHLVTRRRSEAAGGEQDWQILVLDRNEDLYIEEKLVKALTVEHLRHCQE